MLRLKNSRGRSLFIVNLQRVEFNCFTNYPEAPQGTKVICNYTTIHHLPKTVQLKI